MLYVFFVLECRQNFSEDDSEEEEEEPSQHRQDVEQEQNKDMQLNLEVDERFVLPSGQEIEKDILPLNGYSVYIKMGYMHVCWWECGVTLG